MNSILKLGLNLFVICAVSAGLLAGTNEITSPLIAKRSEQASNEARQAVLSDAKEFKLLDQDEEKLVEKVANMIKAKTKNGCTGCRYCMPCPFGIDIPGNFKLWNEYGMLGLKDTAKRRYTNLGDAQAEFCKKCGKCEKLCPQSIKIREDLQRVVQDIKNL